MVDVHPFPAYHVSGFIACVLRSVGASEASGPTVLLLLSLELELELELELALALALAALALALAQA